MGGRRRGVDDSSPANLSDLSGLIGGDGVDSACELWRVRLYLSRERLRVTRDDFESRSLKATNKPQCEE
jgi:hypothetical protein